MKAGSFLHSGVNEEAHNMGAFSPWNLFHFFYHNRVKKKSCSSLSLEFLAGD